ncbi:YIP1 family protein [Paenibacillus sp. MER TA 81-3]|uniref:YIP1 family protein n=1 Tax=Paenibacillus sp. MER TA 81-3 TaxID=2939573 RepID=UPI00203BBD93|nr:YIP1 family protein [Paenibacillus sp. MER TA 81-3]MCM3337637.1 YIP1 family protein [Paenibacillus sp. MER TA 81-3]
MRNVYGKMLLLVLVVFLWFDSSSAVLAEAPYKTYTEDHNRQFVRTQDAYYPAGSIEKVGELEFSGPSDLYIDAHNRIYVADTNNHRIVVTDEAGRLIRTVGEDVLQSPTGVFVDAQGFVYAADGGLGQVVKFGEDGSVNHTYERPESPLFGKNNPFKPLKVAVDKRGNVYIISEGTTNGVVQMSSRGDFLGYFGSNESQSSLRIMLERFFFTDAQRAKLFKNVPPSPTNIAIDKKGLIYTITQGDEGKSVKRFNISGFNLLPVDMTFDPYYTDVYLSRSGNIYTLSQTGIIFEFDTEGNLLFSFGAPDDGKSRIGLFLNAAGIAVDTREHIYVLDKERNNIQIFEPTEFTGLVHHALELYKEGHYVESREPWSQVLRRNNLFDLAHKGLADAYYKQQLYAESIEEYVIANDKEGYSNAFWEIRNRWLQNNLIVVIYLVLAWLLLRVLLRWVQRKTRVFDPVLRIKRNMMSIAFIREVLFLFRFIKNPFDGFYGIKEEQKVSLWSATFLYVLFFVEYVFALYETGFIFNNMEPSNLILMREIAKVFAPFALWIISNYLVSTISEGEGKFSEVYKGTIYAMAPYLVFSPIIVIVSNVLTFNDAFLYSFSSNIVIVWCVVLMFIKVKEIHDYTVGGTIRNILITLFGMLILSLVLFIVYVLLDQVFDFVYSVIRELMVRAEL